MKSGEGIPVKEFLNLSIHNSACQENIMTAEVAAVDLDVLASNRDIALQYKDSFKKTPPNVDPEQIYNDRKAKVATFLEKLLITQSRSITV